MTKGGVILVQLARTNGDCTMKLKTSYKDREGTPYSLTDTYNYPPDSKDNVYEDISTRKAILLMRYVNFMKHFLRDASAGVETQSINQKTGITVPELRSENKNFKALMTPLKEGWKELFKIFINHFEEEMKSIEDPTLDKQLAQLLQIYQVDAENKIK